MSGGEERVPKGYKQTEVGVIPEDWGLKTFGEIFDFKSTASNSRSDLTESDSTHYIHYGDIHTVFHRHLNLEKRDTPMISRELCKNAALVRNGDWVMADASEDYSGICKAIEISGIANEISVVAGLHTFLLRDRVGAYVAGFKGHLGEAKYLHDQYVRVSVGLKVFGVTKTSLRDLFIPVPPKQEQTRIEEILTDSDSQIQALEYLIAKKRDVKQGTMQELLTGKTRLPGFSGEWETRRLGEISEINSESLSSNTDQEYAFTYISLENISRGTLTDSFSVVFKDAPSRARRVVRKNDVLISTVRPNLMSHYYIVNEVNDFICSTGFSVLRTREKLLHGPFVYHHMMASVLNKQIELLLVGSNYPAINSKDVEGLKIPVPHLIEQKAIAKILSDMDAEIIALGQRLEKAKAIKQGMMQQLLTGRIRLVEPSTPVEANA